MRTYLKRHHVLECDRCGPIIDFSRVLNRGFTGVRYRNEVLGVVILRDEPDCSKICGSIDSQSCFLWPSIMVMETIYSWDARWRTMMRGIDNSISSRSDGIPSVPGGWASFHWGRSVNSFYPSSGWKSFMECIPFCVTESILPNFLSETPSYLTDDTLGDVNVYNHASIISTVVCGTGRFTHAYSAWYRPTSSHW